MSYFRYALPILLLALSSIVAPLQSKAQDLHVSAKVDSNNILVGDPLKIHFIVEHPVNVTVAWPAIADSLQGIQIVRQDTIRKVQTGASITESLDVTITGYDSGSFVIPPLPFSSLAKGDSTVHSAETSAIPVFVHGIAVDTSKDIKDIKPPFSLGITFAEMLPYLIAAAVIGLLVWLFYYIGKRRSRGESIIPEAPKRPAHEIALDALRSLDAEHVWQRGMVKQYYSQLTDVLRTYIEGRFGVLAMEMTTDEIMDSKSIGGLTRETKDPLRELLMRADFVKFAKFQPTSQENEAGMTAAVRFVEQTWRRMEPIVEQPMSTEIVTDEVRKS
ncbi:MAG TPA: hypothetical protein VKS81_03810 [Bacteroidota bacterium]|nr:hypothetical protein [Bacteroidota bacterium]